MGQFRQGDAKAFEELFHRHAPAIRSFLFRMVGDNALTEDLLQRTFLSVVVSRDRFHAPARVTPWFYAIATNAARDAMRHRRRTPEQLAAPESMPEGEGSPAATGDPVLRKRIDAALLELSPEQREAVILHFVEGWSFDDIAEALQIGLVTARVRAHRGTKKLRALLGGLELN